jgi:hypothetical protein
MLYISLVSIRETREIYINLLCVRDGFYPKYKTALTLTVTHYLLSVVKVKGKVHRRTIRESPEVE